MKYHIFKTTQGSKYFLFFLILQILSHNFLFFNHIIENTHYLIIFIILFLFSIFYKDFHSETIHINFRKIELKNIYISIIIFFPIILYFIKTYDADFNWGGDHRDNILFSLVNTKFWLTQIFSNDISNYLSSKEIIINFYKSRIFYLLILILITFYLYKNKYGNLANLVLIISFFLSSTFDQIPNTFGIKDPQGTNFINIFSNLIFYLFDLSLLETLGLTNLISIFFWAVYLRPIFLNENLDLKILPFIFIYAWYPKFIYLHVQAGPEPWALIFLFLALENFFKNGTDKIFLTVIFLGIGTCFKSQIALFVPVFSFLYLFEKTFFSKKISLIFLSSLVLFNTSTFSYVREKIYNRWQPIQIENYGFNHLNDGFFDLVFLRLSEINSLLIIFLLCIFIIIKNFKINKKKILYFIFISILIFCVLFFNNMPKFIQHTLYTRYYIYFYVVILFYVFFETYNNKKLTNIFLIILTLVVYSKDLYKFFNFNKENIYKLNFSQFDSDPLYLGLNQIIENSSKDLKNKNIQEIYVGRSTEIIYRIPKYLYKKYKINDSPKYKPFCNCNDDNQAILNFYPKMRNFVVKYKTNMPASPEGYGSLYGKEIERKKYECLGNIEKTCSIVHLLKEEDNTTIAILGIR